MQESSQHKIKSKQTRSLQAMNSTSSVGRRRPLHSLPPTEIQDIGNGLSLSPRLKLLLNFFRSDPAVKPIDEWKIRISLLDFLRSSLSLSVHDDDLILRKCADLHKRKRDEPVASGTLYVRDLGFLKSKGGEDEEFDAEVEWKRFFDWRGSVVDRLGGIELSLEGVKFRMSVEIPPSDDFERMKKSWEDLYASQLLENRSSSRGTPRRPDTVVIAGIPSRWFAEPRVSSKPSMLVTHTIFSVLGAIRKLDVAGDDDLGKKSDEKGEFVSGLECKVWVQFDSHDDFCNAMKVLCGRSMQKQGSRLKVDYEITWEREGFFRSVQQRPSRGYMQERGGQMQVPAGNTRHEAPRHRSQITHSDSYSARSRRFRD